METCSRVIVRMLYHTACFCFVEFSTRQKSRTTSVEKTKQKTYREKSPLFKRGRFGTLSIKAYRSVAQFGSVRRLGRCGRRFESCHSELEKNQRTNRSYISLLFKASLVQLVERRSPKPDVVGSSPTGRV